MRSGPRIGQRVLRAAVAAVAGPTLLAVSSCSIGQLSEISITKDNRLTFTAPAARSLVKTPLTVSWRMRDFTATDTGPADGKTSGRYAVFVDRTPFTIGETLASVGKNDPQCKSDKTGRCVTKEYLDANFVYVTTDTQVDVTFLPRVADGVGDEQHTISVILLDGTGARRSESAWFVNFRFPRRSK